MTNASEDLFTAGPFFLQRLFPDETLYSWCARYHRLSGNRLARDTSLQLFASPTAGFWHDLPSHLGAFQKRTRQQLGDAEAICRQHTLLRYYIPFRSASLIRESIETMTGASVRDLKFRLGLPASRIGANHPLKACPTCMAEDQAATGIAYWHLEHQYPSVWVCPKHSSKLMQCTSRTKTTQRLQWVLPDMVDSDSWLHYPDLRGPGAQFAQKLAQISCDAVQPGNQNLDPTILRDCGLKAAHERGWLQDSGRANLMAIREEFLDQASGIADVPGLDFVRGAAGRDGGFLGSILRSDRAHKHPVKYLVLIAFLFDSWKKLVTFAHECGPNSDHHSLTESDHRRTLLAQKIRDNGLTVSEAARRLSLPLSKAMYWAKKDQLPFERRPRKVDGDLAREIAYGLAQGLSCEEVAQKTTASIDAVRRYRDTHGDVRAAWNAARGLRQRDAFRRDFLEVMQANPDAHQTRLRKTPGSHFDWLRKHDHEWLANQLPGLWRLA